MTKSVIDNLIYIDDYIDSKFGLFLNQQYILIFNFSAVEALQIDLQKNFTLLKEMDGYAQGDNKWPNAKLRFIINTSFRFKLYYSESSY